MVSRIILCFHVLWPYLKWTLLMAAIIFLWREGVFVREHIALGDRWPAWIACAIGFSASVWLGNCFRFYFLLLCLGESTAPKRQIRLHFAGMFLAQIGSTMAFDALRLAAAKKWGCSFVSTFVATMMDRILGISALGASALSALALFGFGGGWLPAIAAGFAALIAIPSFFLLCWRLKTTNRVSFLFRLPGTDFMSSLGKSLFAYRRNIPALSALFILSFATHSMFFASLYCCGRALENLHVSFAESFTGGALALFSYIPPLPMSGLGLGEAVFGEVVANMRGTGSAADFIPIFLFNRFVNLMIAVLGWLWETLYRSCC